MPDAESSVTNWLRKLETGHDSAAQHLWDVFFKLREGLQDLFGGNETVYSTLFD